MCHLYFHQVAAVYEALKWEHSHGTSRFALDIFYHPDNPSRTMWHDHHMASIVTLWIENPFPLDSRMARRRLFGQEGRFIGVGLWEHFKSTMFLTIILCPLMGYLMEVGVLFKCWQVGGFYGKLWSIQIVKSSYVKLVSCTIACTQICVWIWRANFQNG